MSGDGAHAGVGAERALSTILGGEPSPDDTGEDTMTPQQMREWIESAPEEPQSYDDAARLAARMVLRARAEHPELRDAPMETVYRDWDVIRQRGEILPEDILERNLYDLMKDHGYPLDELGLSGFQWGWAFNAAAYCEGRPPQQNPAIVHVEADR